MQLTAILTQKAVAFGRTCLVMLFLLPAQQQVFSQIMTLHSDPEFDEDRIRKHLLIRGIPGDSTELLLNEYKFLYYQNLEALKARQSMSGSPVSDGTSSDKVCECYSSSCLTDGGSGMVEYLHGSFPGAAGTLSDIGSFFDGSVSPYAGWFAKNSNNYVSNTWQFVSTWSSLGSSIGFGQSDRYKVNINPLETDPFTNERVMPAGSIRSLRVGSPDFGIHGQKMSARFVKQNGDASFDIQYSIVLYDPPVGHSESSSRPAFSIRVFVQPEGSSTFYEDCCLKYEVYSSPDIPGFKRSEIDNSIVYKPWSSRSIDLGRYANGSTVVVEISTHHCAWGPHFSYAYVDGQVNNPKQISKKGPLCTGTQVVFSSGMFGTYKTEDITWKVTREGETTPEATASYTVTYPSYTTIPELLAGPGNETIKNALNFRNVFNSDPEDLPVNYTVTLTIGNGAPGAPDCPPIVLTRQVQITDCYPLKVECDDCLPSFSPLHGKKYVISAWVKQQTSSYLTTYTEPEIRVRFNGVDMIAGPFKGSGPIIDGWQKVEETFTVPEEATSLEIELRNAGSGDVFFDDIRVFPFDGVIKTFVYNATDFKLRAELDENNYATFYDYDEQGELVRVKKETVKGVQTVREIFTNIRKEQ